LYWTILAKPIRARSGILQGLPFSADYPQPVRVVRSQETLTQNHYRRGKLESETTAQEWLWITTLAVPVFPPELVRRLGHDRWKQENNGWNDLTQNWAFKHGFLHACRHRPKTTAENGPPQPVPNRGLAAVILILLLAFTLWRRSPIVTPNWFAVNRFEHPRGGSSTALLAIQTSA